MHNHLLTLLLFLLFCTHTHGQTERQTVPPLHEPAGTMATPNEKRGFFDKLFGDSDTLYVEPNHYNVTLMTEQSTWYERFYLKSRLDGREQKISFSPSAR